MIDVLHLTFVRDSSVKPIAPTRYTAPEVSHLEGRPRAKSKQCSGDSYDNDY